jgi:hypothetical protein
MINKLKKYFEQRFLVNSFYHFYRAEVTVVWERFATQQKLFLAKFCTHEE